MRGCALYVGLAGKVSPPDLPPDDLLRDLLGLFPGAGWVYLHALVVAASAAPDADHGYQIQQGGLDGDAVTAVHVFFQIDADESGVHGRIVT